MNLNTITETLFARTKTNAAIIGTVRRIKDDCSHSSSSTSAQAGNSKASKQKLTCRQVISS